MQAISTLYRNDIMQMLKKSWGAMTVTPDNVYQPGNPAVLPHIDTMIAGHLSEKSAIRNLQNLEKLSEMAAQGKSCLLLVEHYSNFDLPVFHYLLRKAGEKGHKAAEKLIAIAGYKLNETNPVVTAFTEAYSRLVIYPSRSLQALKEKNAPRETLITELAKSNSINHASLKKLNELKVTDKLILVYPSGTRFRPWDPSTKRGVREIDSYIRAFDYICLVSMNGGILFINPEGEMHEDYIGKGHVLFDASEPIATDDFREDVKNHLKDGEDRKQAIVDEVMRRLDVMHQAMEAELVALGEA